MSGLKCSPLHKWPTWCCYMEKLTGMQPLHLYEELFPGRILPCAQTFANVTQHLREPGSFALCTLDRGRQRTDRILDLEPEILDAVENEPQISTRRLVIHKIHASQSTVWRVLHREGLYPYHLKLVQTLHPTDPPNRTAFYRWLLDKIPQAPVFLGHVLCTDEVGFTHDGVFNSHNTQVWADENPHAVHEHWPQEQ